MTVLVGLLIIYLMAGAVMAIFTAIAQSPKYKQYRINDPAKRPVLVNWSRTTKIGSLVSAFFFITLSLLLGQFLYSDLAAFTLWQPFLALFLYDFLYMWYHRMLHIKWFMRKIHGVHHRARYPIAQESVYFHILESLGALTILLFSIWVFGPLHPIAFLIVFFFYAMANILIHTNLVFPSKWAWLLNYWAVRHAYHHTELDKNYSSIFLTFDRLFRTYK